MMQTMQNTFLFLDYCIWIGCRKIWPLRRKDLLPAVNVLTSNPKIPDITKENFSNSIFLRVVREYDKSASL